MNSSAESDSGVNTELLEMDCLTSWGDHGMAGTAGGNKLLVHYKRKAGRPLCGDRILVNVADPQPAVVTILPQVTRFARADSRGRQQWIAANTDQACIIIAPEPAPSRDLIDRYLVACELLALRPLLILHKADLDDGRLDALRARLRDYQALGYKHLEVSARTALGSDQLQAQLQHQRTLFTGQSGVGKSSLINRLIPDRDIQTKALSRVTGKGTHTTSTACMYYLPDGGSVIDTPGVWEYALWSMPASELAAGFVEFRPFLGQCRFRDCNHINTPGCALAAAAGKGVITAHRTAVYGRLLTEQMRFIG